MATALSTPTSRIPFHRFALWHRSAPRALRDAWYAGDAQQRWAVWKDHLAQRSPPLPHLAGKKSPILWGWPDAWGRTEVATSLAALARWSEVLTARPHGGVDLPQALQAVATAYALPQLAAELPADAWWRLAESLHALVGEAQEAPVDLRTPPPDVVRQQLLGGELPLVLSYLFPELRPMRALRPAARQALADGIDALTDGDGTPYAGLLPVLGPLAACWTRARWLGTHLNRGAWSAETDAQFRRLLRRAIRLANDGRCLLADDDAKVPGWRLLVDKALELVGDVAERAAAAAVRSQQQLPPRKRAKPLPKASFNSEWSGLAVLSTGWTQADTRLTVNYADHPLRIELTVGRRKLLAGDWVSETTCNGRRVEAVGKWEETCWQSDKDCDFLEMRIELADGLRLERQIVLAKRDAVLLVADVVLARDREPRQLQHRYSLPLLEGVAWRPEAETRDGVLVYAKRRAAVLPMALGEWRSDPRGGNLSSEPNRLTLTQQAVGRAIYCPLLVDLDARRSQRERTWRQLTVAESRAALPRDVAVGFRGQSGDDQWLVYRSLGPCGNRSVLGQNISNEFLAGRFRRSGLVDEWIEIEVEASS